MQLAQAPRYVERGVSVPDVWSPEQHLYVKGNVGLPAKELSALEKWLDTNAPNWTVYLANNASGEFFRDTLGQNFQGMNAVEESMGTRLPNQTAFGKIIHPETKEKAGAYMIIFLKERKFSYHASEAYDTRALGEDNWIGNLDATAIRAMRSGGRISDAVTDTVSSIENKLSQTIQNQKTQARYDKENSFKKLTETENLYSYVKEEERKFLLKYSQGTVLTKADWEQIESEISQSKAQNEMRQFSASSKSSTSAITKMKNWLENLDRLSNLPSLLEETKAILASTEPNSWNKKGTALRSEAEEELLEAQTALEQGDFSASDKITSVLAKIDTITNSNQAIERKISTTKTAFTGGATTLALLGSALALYLNRRRKPSKVEALSELKEWQIGFRERRDRIFNLLDRCRSNIGNQEDLKNSRITGTTRELSEEALRDVDELFVMSGCVDRLIKEAEELSEPSGIGKQLGNFVGKSKYNKTLQLLRDHPVRFTAEEGLEMILKRENGQTYGPVINDPSSRKSFNMTFEELISAFDKKANEVEEEITRIENGWSHVIPKLKAVGSQLESIGENSATLYQKSLEDGQLSVPSLVETELPRLEDKLREVTETGEIDPVRAVEEQIPTLSRQSTEANEFSQIVLDFRNTNLPNIIKQGEELAQNDLNTEWIAEHLEATSTKADLTLTQLQNASISEEIGEVKTSLQTLSSNVSTAVDIKKTANGLLTTRLKKIRSLLEQTRGSIGNQLNLPSTKILDGEQAKHDRYNPDTWLTQADSLFTSIDTSINRGKIDSASKNKEDLEHALNEAEGLIEDAQRALKENPPRIDETAQKQESLITQYQQYSSTIENLKNTYSEDALQLKHITKDLQDNQSTLPILQKAYENLNQIQQTIQQTKTLHQEGNLFHCASILDTIQIHHEQIEFCYEQIAHQEKSLALAEKEVSDQQQTLELKLEEIKASTGDHRVSRANHNLVSQMEQKLDQITRITSLAPGEKNPFRAQAYLQELHKDTESLSENIKTDFERHSAATDTIRDTDAQILVAEKLTKEAQADKIPNSSKTDSLISKIHNHRDLHNQHVYKLKKPAENWERLDKASHDLLEEASKDTADLQQELELAQSCISSVHNAAAEVRRARHSSGLLGSIIGGSKPGKNSLQASHERLRRGDYHGAKRYARQALLEASSAMERARARASARRRARVFDGVNVVIGGGPRTPWNRGGFSRGRGSIFGNSRGGGTFGSRSRSSTIRSNSGTSRSGW